MRPPATALSLSLYCQKPQGRHTENSPRRTVVPRAQILLVRSRRRSTIRPLWYVSVILRPKRLAASAGGHMRVTLPFLSNYNAIGVEHTSKYAEICEFGTPERFPS